jgi:hypothetical protein
MEVDLERKPEEGQVLIFTNGGGFAVNGRIQDVVERLSHEEWPTFELSESGDTVVVRSSNVVALRGGTRHKRGSIGFVDQA